MSKLHTRASVAGASLSGANLKATNLSTWDALQAVGVTDATRTTVTASATLTLSQCGILLVDCSAGSVTLTLPTSGTATDEAEYRIRRIDSTPTNTLTVQRGGGTDTVEGATTAVSMAVGGQIDFKMPAGSTNWRVTGRSGGTAAGARAALGSGTAGDAVFVAATEAAGRAALGFTAAVIDRAYAEYTANADISTVIPYDDTIPQVTEGTQILSASITPKSTTTRLRVRFNGYGSVSALNDLMVMAFFVNGAANAVAAGVGSNAPAVGMPVNGILEYEYVPGTTAAQTITVRVGTTSGTIRLNGTTTARRFGGTSRATLVIEELAV